MMGVLRLASVLTPCSFVHRSCLPFALQDYAAKHVSRCRELGDDQFAVLAGATVDAVLGERALEDSAAASSGSLEKTSEAEAGIALLVTEAAKGGISGEDLEVRTRGAAGSPLRMLLGHSGFTTWSSANPLHLLFLTSCVRFPSTHTRASLTVTRRALFSSSPTFPLPP